MISCREITKSIVNLRVKGDNFVSTLGVIPVAESRKLKDEIETLIEDAEKGYACDLVFLESLENNSVFVAKMEEYIKDRIKYNWPDWKSAPEKIMKFYVESTSRKQLPGKNLTTKRYGRFLKNFLKSEICQRFMTIVANLESDEQINREVIESILLQSINTIFLNFSCGKEKVIIEKLPAKLFHRFALGLDNANADIEIGVAGELLAAEMKNGCISAGEVDGYAGSGMEGGKLSIKKAGRYCGISMLGGILMVAEAGTNFCTYMRGGKAIVQKAGKQVFLSMKGGVGIAGETVGMACDEMYGGFVYLRKPSLLLLGLGEIKSGDVLIESSEAVSVATDESDQNVWHPQKGISLYYQNQVGGVIRSPRPSLSPEMLFDDANSSEIPFEIGAQDLRNNFNPTEGLQKTFVVLHQDLPEFGKNMTGGAVILEIEGLTIEEARKKISKDKKGGAILMRVPNPDKPGETYLIDIEEENLD